MATMNHFHQNCQMVRSTNAASIAFVPKRKGAMEHKEFRPISLIGSVYKIVAKVLAERVKTVTGRLI